MTLLTPLRNSTSSLTLPPPSLASWDDVTLATQGALHGDLANKLALGGTLPYFQALYTPKIRFACDVAGEMVKLLRSFRSCGVYPLPRWCATLDESWRLATQAGLRQVWGAGGKGCVVHMFDAARVVFMLVLCSSGQLVVGGH